MKVVLLVVLFCCLHPVAYGESWPAFRGPHGNGMTASDDYPTRWSATENVAWSVDLPQPGNGSPIVVGSRVLVTSAKDTEGRSRSLFCFDAESGEQLWEQSIDYDAKMPTHKTNPYCGSTPASDGKTVVVWHGSAGLHAYTIDGEPLWSKDLGEFRHMWGYGTSPVIEGNRVILHTGPGERVFVSAFDLATGGQLWQHEEPVDGSGERNSKGNYMGSWATPVIHEVDGQKLAVCPLATRVCGFDVGSGKLIWFCEGLRGDRGDLAYSSPMIEGDLCVAIGGFRGPGLGFRMKGTGNLTAERLWRNTKNPQNVGTGLLIGGHVYRLGAGPSGVDCLDATSGNVVWTDRADEGTYWGSLVYDGKQAMATDQRGRTLVFRPSPEGMDQTAVNALEDECNATPALADGKIYIRTFKKLWCIAKQ